jgi:hypothetical protein
MRRELLRKLYENDHTVNSRSVVVFVGVFIVMVLSGSMYFTFIGPSFANLNAKPYTRAYTDVMMVESGVYLCFHVVFTCLTYVSLRRLAEAPWLQDMADVMSIEAMGLRVCVTCWSDWNVRNV